MTKKSIHILVFLKQTSNQRKSGSTVTLISLSKEWPIIYNGICWQGALNWCVGPVNAHTMHANKRSPLTYFLQTTNSVKRVIATRTVTTCPTESSRPMLELRVPEAVIIPSGGAAKEDRHQSSLRLVHS